MRLVLSTLSCTAHYENIGVSGRNFEPVLKEIVRGSRPYV